MRFSKKRIHTLRLGRTTMSIVTVIGVDLAKSIFHLQGNDNKGNCVFKKKLSRSQFSIFMQQQEPAIVAMEACCGAHRWAREFRKMGHKPRLISPQFVKPFVKGNKNDRNDAAAICEAVVRPSMRFVPVKESWHTDLQAIHRVRTRLSQQRTAVANEMRGILAEAGVICLQGMKPLKMTAKESIVSDETGLSSICRETVADLLQELNDIEDRIEVQEKRLGRIADQSPVCKELTKISGVGKITSTALIAAVPDPKAFKNGRHFSAWLGLVPRHSGTGGKNTIGGISKRGDKNLRCLLVHGARSSIRTVGKRNDRISNWAASLKEKSGYNKAAVALANKNARGLFGRY